MTSIESEKLLIEEQAEKLYIFLSNFNNFGKLMPNQVTNWKSTETECSFTIQGMADIILRIVDKQPFNRIRIAASGKTPVPLELVLTFNSLTEHQTETCLAVNADLNPMMSMMVKSPLQNFVNMLVGKLKEMADSRLL